MYVIKVPMKVGASLGEELRGASLEEELRGAQEI
jgi:hypothetical protein